MCPRMFHAKLHFAGCILLPPFLELAKTWPFHSQNMVLTWSFKLVLPESESLCPGMFHAKFYIAGSILLPLFLEMAKTSAFYGQNMVHTWSFKLFLPES